MNISSWFWTKAVEALLACYPAAWRTRFAAQVQADLEDARQEHSSPMELALWMLASVWDLARGGVSAHLSAMKTKSAVMAVAGGGASQQELVDNRRVFKIVVRQLPSWLVLVALTMLAGLMIGLWLYDVKMFLVYGLTGFVLLVFPGRTLYKKMKASLAYIAESDNPTESFARTIMLLVFALFICAFYFTSFNLISNQSTDAANAVNSISFAAVASMPANFIIALVAYVLLLSITGCLLQSPSHTPHRAVVAGCMAVAWLGGVFAIKAEALNALGATVLVLPLVFLLLGAWNRRPWAQVPALAMSLLALPLLLGSLLGISLDASKSQEQLDAVIGVSASTPTLFDQSHAYKEALDQVRAGSPDNVFWNHLVKAREDRRVWQANKPLTAMYDPKPLGVTALYWCMFQQFRHSDRAIEYCASQPDPDRILERAEDQ